MSYIGHNYFIEQLYKRNTTFITEKEFYSSSDAFKYNSNEKFQIISLRLPVAHTLGLFVFFFQDF